MEKDENGIYVLIPQCFEMGKNDGSGYIKCSFDHCFAEFLLKLEFAALLGAHFLIKQGKVCLAVDFGRKKGPFIIGDVVDQPLHVIFRSNECLSIWYRAFDITTTNNRKFAIFISDWNYFDGFDLTVRQLICHFYKILIHNQVL